MSGRVVLETRRLILREMTMEDHAPLLAVLSDPLAMKYYPRPFDGPMVEQWIRWGLSGYKERGFGLWAMVHREEDRVIGDCGLTIQLVDGIEEIEIGYHLLRSHWGRGYATEAASACRDWVFDVLDRDRVISWMGPENAPSRRVAERVGMKLEKQTKNRYGKDAVVYSVERGEWGDRGGSGGSSRTGPEAQSR